LKEFLTSPLLFNIFLTITKTEHINDSEEQILNTLYSKGINYLMFTYSYNKIKNLTYDKCEEHLSILEEVSKNNNIYLKILKGICFSLKAEKKLIFNEKDLDNYLDAIENKPDKKYFEHFKILLKSNLLNIIFIYNENYDFKFIKNSLLEYILSSKLDNDTTEKNNDNKNENDNKNNNDKNNKNKKKGGCNIL
jgi:hypothetical protein